MGACSVPKIKLFNFKEKKDMKNTHTTAAAAAAATNNKIIKFSKKVFNFNVIVNDCGVTKAAQESGYKLEFKNVLLGIQKQKGTNEKYIIDIETGLIIFKIKNLKMLTFETLEKWIEKAIDAKEKMKNNHNSYYGGVSALDYYKNIVKNI